MHLFIRRLFFLLTFIVLFFSCEDLSDPEVLNNENSITAFKITSNDINLEVKIENSEIIINVPYNVTLDNVDLEVLISEGAKITPNPLSIKSIKDNTITFTVTAEDGSEKIYEAKIIKEKSPENTIQAFKIIIDSEEIDVEIDNDKNVIEYVLPFTYNLTTIEAEITIPENASINPNPSEINDYTEPVTYEITAENGESVTYEVILTKEKSPENAIQSLVIKDVEGEDIEAIIEDENNVINYVLPYDYDLTLVNVDINISEKATISPDPKEINDYTQPVTYEITAENGESVTYEVILTKEKSPENYITSFVILNSSLNIEATINEENKTINQKLPEAIDLTNINVEITISDKASISPEPSTITDYSNPITYTVTSEDEQTKEYIVSLIPMVDDVFVNCDIDNAFKWFGGDIRGITDNGFYHEPRNVGTGQSITPVNDLNPKSFSIRFRDHFVIADNSNKIYIGEGTIRLHVRNEQGQIIETVDKIIQSPFTDSLWVKFNLEDYNLVFKKDKVYYFTWYLVDGEELGIYASSTGNKDEHTGLCNGMGLNATSMKLKETHLDDWDIWEEHSWHFNFRLEGKE